MMSVKLEKPLVYGTSSVFPGRLRFLITMEAKIYEIFFPNRLLMNIFRIVTV
jgi:hypothetical protein